MEKIVESKLFTDEQKVSVIKAVLEKKIGVTEKCEFVKNGDYYFIKTNDSERKYSYVMTFVGGFQYYLLYNRYDEEFMKVFVDVKYPLTSDISIRSTYNDDNKPGDNKTIITFNNETFYPYLIYNTETKSVTYLPDGKNTNFIKGIIANKKIVQWNITIFNLIEYAAKNDINLVSLKTDDIVDISYNRTIGAYVFKYANKTFDMCGPNIKKEQKEEQKQKEKDKFMLAIDSFADSETLKKTIFGKKIENYKQRIITYISKAIENNESSVEAYKGDLYSTPEITEFLKYICDTKKYTITTNNLSFQIQFY